MAENNLDVRGTCCPMPLIRLAKVVKDLEEGALVEVIGDDPIFELGVREFCAARGYTVEEVEVEGKDTRLTVRVGEAPQSS